MRYFPIFLDLDDRVVLVAGGGEKAAQKVRLLLKTQARITVVAERIGREIAELAGRGVLKAHARAFRPSDLDGAVAAFAAHDKAAEDKAVAVAARARAIPVNVVDGPRESTFLMPAIVDRAPVTVAIGTEGTAPVLARDLKAEIERRLPANFGLVAREAGRLRTRLQREIASFDARRRVWERLITGAFRRHVLAGDVDAADRSVAEELHAARIGGDTVGAVTLIGCGPGDPDLLTLKAQQRLQEADVLVVDRLVNPQILEYARREARRIFVGKDPEGNSTAQGEINRILVREALKGRRVARLKGGDAFVFGRAAEEMAAVRAAGIAVEVVPGVTAAHACAASIGLPMTLRHKVRQFSVVTGATADGEAELDWAALARPGQAFAIYMGVRTGPVLAGRLIGAGAAPGTRVVVVENGTLANERIVVTTLSDLSEALTTRSIKGPAIVFVGLDWDDARLSRPAKAEVFVPAAAAHEKARSDRQPWTSAEIANATFWVAG